MIVEMVQAACGQRARSSILSVLDERGVHPMYRRLVLALELIAERLRIETSQRKRKGGVFVPPLYLFLVRVVSSVAPSSRETKTESVELLTLAPDGVQLG